MSNKQQTAVEWLFEQLQLLELNKNRISAYAYESRIHYTISKAKEMHKQQTINNKTMINNNQKTAVEWYDNQLRRVFSNTTDTSTFTHEELLEQAKEMEKEQQDQLSESWAKSREQTRKIAMHIGFSKGFMSGLECHEDYYLELERWI